MFEYILLIQLCSLIENSCSESTKYFRRFDTYKACMVNGYEANLKMTMALPNEIVNKDKLFFQFTCFEIEK